MLEVLLWITAVFYIVNHRDIIGGPVPMAALVVSLLLRLIVVAMHADRASIAIAMMVALTYDAVSHYAPLMVTSQRTDMRVYCKVMTGAVIIAGSLFWLMTEVYVICAADYFIQSRVGAIARYLGVRHVDTPQVSEEYKSFVYHGLGISKHLYFHLTLGQSQPVIVLPWKKAFKLQAWRGMRIRTIQMLYPEYSACDHEKCGMCTDTAEAGTMRQLQCGHVFHCMCIDSVFVRTGAQCPLCHLPAIVMFNVVSRTHVYAHVLGVPGKETCTVTETVMFRVATRDGPVTQLAADYAAAKGLGHVRFGNRTTINGIFF